MLPKDFEIKYYNKHESGEKIMNTNTTLYYLSKTEDKNEIKTKKGRTHNNKRRIYFASTILVSAIVLIITLSTSMQTKANEKFETGDRIYSSILIEEGDTLWDIAKEYKPAEISVTNYIQSIKKINGLNSDSIHSGNYLIIYYYEN